MVFAIALCLFLLSFYVLDEVAQKWQGLWLFQPEGH